MAMYFGQSMFCLLVLKVERNKTEEQELSRDETPPLPDSCRGTNELDAFPLYRLRQRHILGVFFGAIPFLGLINEGFPIRNEQPLLPASTSGAAQIPSDKKKFSVAREIHQLLDPYPRPPPPLSRLRSLSYARQ